MVGVLIRACFLVCEQAASYLCPYMAQKVKVKSLLIRTRILAGTSTFTTSLKPNYLIKLLIRISLHWGTISTGEFARDTIQPMVLLPKFWLSLAYQH